MHKTLLQQATRNIRNLSDHIHRAEYNFIPKRSIIHALNELEETKKLLIKAQDALAHAGAPNAEPQDMLRVPQVCNLQLMS
jgi:hypothetical protein